MNWEEGRKRLREIEAMPSGTIEELRTKMAALVKCEAEEAENTEEEHHLADQALIAYINDPEVARLFNELGKWYS